MRKYILENESEFERLEKQSNTSLYDHKKDLSSVPIPHAGQFLDIGCGSGVITRYLAEQRPSCSVLGVDMSELRVQQAKRKVTKEFPNLKNIHFEAGDVTRLSYPNESFQFIVCRYVMHHLPHEKLQSGIQELFRCLKPGGVLCVVDIDGAFINFHPQTPLVKKVLSQMEQTKDLDLKVGRKIPYILKKTGFSEVNWRIVNLDFQKEDRDTELELNRERFLGFRNFLSTLLNGDQTAVEQFIAEYLETMSSPECVAYYDKFIVTAKK